MRRARGAEEGGSRRAWRATLVLALVAAAAPAAAGGVLRVGTSGDYRPFSHAASEEAPPEGFDVALLREFAAATGRELVFVPFGWPKLVADLEAGRFDVAASGITVRPERSVVGLFTVSLAETRALALARTPERWGGDATLDRPQIRIGVNAGGHLERVARAHFPRATLLAVPDNGSVIGLLIDHHVHAVVTDEVEAPHWEEQVEEPLARIGPLSRDRKAWLVRADRPELAAELDAWLLAREGDGTLAARREEWLGEAQARSAEPLTALLAALDERLSLMPWVGIAKRRDGLPIADPRREAQVIERALADLRAAAEAAAGEPPPDAAVRALFRAQIEAAKRVQMAAARADGALDDALAPPDLETALRPALLRVGSRIARLLLALPPGLERSAVRAAARDALRAPHLEDADRDALADAIAAISAASRRGVNSPG